MGFKKMAKAQNCAFIRDAIQSDLGKTTHGFYVVQAILHRRVTELIPLLHEVNSQLRLQRRWRTASGLPWGTAHEWV